MLNAGQFILYKTFICRYNADGQLVFRTNWPTEMAMVPNVVAAAQWHQHLRRCEQEHMELIGLLIFIVSCIYI